MKFSGKVASGPINKLLNFGGDPDRDTGKTCLGGGMHCPSASSLILFYSCLYLYNIHVKGGQQDGRKPFVQPATAPCTFGE